MRPRRILLRSLWQTVNIGDIGHAPGMLQLLAEHLPEVEVSLWPGDVGRGVSEMLERNFPRVRIVQGEADLKAAFAECDFMLHGSGPYLLGKDQLVRWRDDTAKPYGIYGITLGQLDDETRSLINGARFAFFRDSVSLEYARSHGITVPVVDFAPDCAFGVRVRNEEAAAAFLKEKGLEDGRFLCVIPRLRYTQFWKIYGREMTEDDRRKQEVSEERKERDHSKLREAIGSFVRETGMKVLVCPEDMSQMEVGREMLVEALPPDVKSRVVWREKYWLTDEAVSTYARALALLSMDMHSPIMAVAAGKPAVHCRFREQTSKGIMWRDIGLGEWLFDMDEEQDAGRIAAAVLEMARDPAGARGKVARAMEYVRRRQRETMAVVARAMAG